MNEKQIQRCMAYLELARTAIDNAELRIVGAPDSDRPPVALFKAWAEVVAAENNLHLCAHEINSFALEEIKGNTSASAADRPTAGKPVVP